MPWIRTTVGESVLIWGPPRLSCATPQAVRRFPRRSYRTALAGCVEPGSRCASRCVAHREAASNRERDERLERIVLRERWLARAERELQTVVPPHVHPGGACSADIAGRAGDEQRARRLDAQSVKGEPVRLGPWLVRAC